MIVTAREFTTGSAQVAHYAEVRGRLDRGEKKATGTPSKTSTADALLIGELRAEVAALQKALARTQASLRFVADREAHHRDTQQKLERLELDLADARARILAQAEMMRAIDDDADQITDHRRTVPEIVAEVLSRYPGVTWEDVKSLRRTRELIAPRQACMKAVYDERKDLSLPRIGKIFERDHTTILHAVRKVETERGAE